MSKRARQLAEQMVSTHLSRAGITKAAGAVRADALFGMYLPLAECIAGLEKTARVLDRRARRQDEAAAMIAHQVRVLQALNAADSSPALRGFADFGPGRFRLQHVPGEPPPKRTNGHASHGEGPDPASPPLWHPEND